MKFLKKKVGPVTYRNLGGPNLPNLVPEALEMLPRPLVSKFILKQNKRHGRNTPILCTSI